jgi:protein ImuB
MRIAALWVPDFPLQALRRSTPELAEAPLAVAAGPAPRDPVVAVSAEAAELGVRAGMTAAQARQVAPAVLVRAIPEAAAAAAGEALADVAGGFSPRIRRHRPGEVLLDVGGLTPREEAIAGELLRACRHVGLEARVGIAASVGVARTAARCSELTLVRPGEERRFMAPLPLSLLQAGLEPSSDLAAMLARWGLAAAGELARLPRQEVALRLGTEGVVLHRLACGEETAAFVPDLLQEVLREGVEVDFSLGALEPFLFLLNGVLGRLERRLELRGEGFAEVLLELRLEGGERREVRLKLVAPTREVPAVLALARLQLEASPPGAAVEGVAALVTPGRVRLMQGSLFGPPMPAPGKLSTTLARLAALVGPERVGAPAVPDTHRPGAWSLVPFAPTSEDRGQGTGDREQGTEKQLQESSRGGGELCPVLRAFRPPREARVDAVNDRPAVVWVDSLGGIVVGWAGPYRLVGEWWGDEPFAREDFDVATTDGSLLRIHFDRLEHRWFADGIYD